jgi:hypothetical protein
MSTNEKELFHCIPCNYKTYKSHIYQNHLLRESHKKNVNKMDKKALKSAMQNANEVQNANKVQDANEMQTLEKEEYSCLCGKKYKYKKTLMNHTTVCKSALSSQSSTSSTTNSSSTIIPKNVALYEKANADFKKYVYESANDTDEDDIQTTININKDNDTTTTTTIVDDDGNMIIEKTTYSTTNSSTDYDVHIDAVDFVKMMNTSLSALKETGDKKAFVNNFFQYMFSHVTDIRHTTDKN